MSEAPLRVLVADDEPLSRWAIGQAVNERGGQVSEAASREEACARLAGADLDVVVMTRQLGGRDMTDVLSELARHRPATRLIVLCEDEPDSSLRARVPGAHVIEKPYSLENVLRVMQAAGASKPA